MDYVITGTGCVSPYGQTTADLLTGIAAGKSALTRQADFACFGQSSGVVGLVNNLDKPDGFPVKFKRTPKCNQMALIAAEQAINESHLPLATEADSVGVFYCTDHGPEEQTCRYLDALFLKSPRLVSPLLFQNTTFAAGAGELSLHYQIKGPSYTVTTGFHSFYLAIDLARMAIDTGRIRYALIVGTDELTTVQFRALVKLGLAAHQANGLNGVGTGNGFIPAEGAAAIILESGHTAVARNIHPMAKISGIGTGHDAQKARQAAANGSGLQHAVRRALNEAGCQTHEIDAVFLSASGFEQLDSAELQAMATVGFNSSGTCYTAIKSLVGESHAASAAIQLIIALDALKHDRVPPTLLHSTDPNYTGSLSQAQKQMPLNRLLLNAQSPGGGSASLILESV